MPNTSASMDTVLQEALLYDWIVKPEKQAYQEDEVIFLNMIYEYRCVKNE